MFSNKDDRKKNTVIIYPIRKEAHISGERYTYELIYKIITELGYESTRLFDAEEKTDSFLSFFSISRFIKLKKISKENLAEIIIIKIPTASQLIILPFLLYGFKGRKIAFIDGVLWKRPPIKILFKIIKNDPIVTLARFIINNPIWCYFFRYSNIKVVCPSEIQKRSIENIIGRNIKIVVIPNGGLADIDLRVIEKKKNDNNKPPIFGYIGHTYYVKGIQTLISSVEILNDEGITPRFVFALSGRGPNVTLPKGANIKSLGVVNRTDFYNKVDVLVFPYLSDLGTNVFPSVLLESMMKGIPVITSDTPIAKEMFGDIENAIFFPAGNEMALAECIKNAYTGALSTPDPEVLTAKYHKAFSYESLKEKWLQEMS